MNEPATSYVVSNNPITSIFGEDGAGDDPFDAHQLGSSAIGDMTRTQQNWRMENRQNENEGAYFYTTSLDHGSRYNEVGAVQSEYNQLGIDQSQAEAMAGYTQYQYGTATPPIDNIQTSTENLQAWYPEQYGAAGEGRIVDAGQQGYKNWENRMNEEYRSEGQDVTSTFDFEHPYAATNQMKGDEKGEIAVADVQHKGTEGLQGDSGQQGGPPPPPMAFRDQSADSSGPQFQSIDSIQGKNMHTGSEHYGAGFLPPGVSHVPRDMGSHQDSVVPTSYQAGDDKLGGANKVILEESGKHAAATNPTTWQSNAIFGGDETETGQEQVQGATLAWEQRALEQNSLGGPHDFRTARKIFDSDSDSLPDLDVSNKTEESPARTKLQRYDDLMKKLGKDQHKDGGSTMDTKSKVQDSNKQEIEDSKIKINPNLQAGRRKLEEFKRKKAAALSRKNSAQKQGDSPSSEHRVSRTQHVEPHAADSSQDEIVRLKRELGMAAKELEMVDGERNNLQREKASLLGEIMSLKAIAESKPRANADAEKAIELLKDELDTVKSRCQSLETNLKDKDIMCISLSEENSNLQKEMSALKINSGVVFEREQADHLGAEIENLRTALSAVQAENETLRANHETALRQERETREQLEQDLEDSKDNIESLRELLGEGEQERLGMAETIAALRRDLENAQVPQQEISMQDSNVHLELQKKIQDLESSLQSAEQDIAEWKTKCQETSTEQYQPSGSPVSPSLDSNSLRVRLAKAEAAVETERRTIQILEQKLKDNQDQEQSISTLRNELSLSHKREEELERKLAESGSSNAPYNTPPGSKSIREAHKRAEEAEQAAQLLQIQLDSSSQTIMKLSDEVNDLTTRLNEQADIIISMRQNVQPFDTVPLTAPQPINNSPPSPTHQYMDPQDYHEVGMYQELETRPPGRSDETHGAEAEQQPLPAGNNHYQQQQEEEQIWSIPGAKIESIRSIPEAPRLGSAANSTRDASPNGSQAPPRKIGFWQWVAGADLASAD